MKSPYLIFAWRFFIRDWRAGELRLFFLALVVAITAVASVGFLSERINLAIQRDVGETLAADLIVESTQPATKNYLKLAEQHRLRTAQTAEFRSMLIVGDHSSLAQVKAVTADYPLRGQLEIASGENLASKFVSNGLPQGKAWLEKALLEQLGIQTGSMIQLGNIQLQAGAVLIAMPDQGLQLVNFAPHVLINWHDFLKTGLMLPGSRIVFKLLVAGQADDVQAFRKALGPQLKQGERFVSIDNAQPQVKKNITRAQYMLSLMTLLTVMVAGIAIAMASQRFNKRYQNSIAVMRSLGASAGLLRQVLLLEFVFLTVVGSGLGTLFGFAGHYLLMLLMAGSAMFGKVLPVATLWPAMQAISMGFVMVFGFAIPPLWRLSQASPLRVLRHDLPVLSVHKSISYGIAGLVLSALVIWFAQDLKLAFLILLGTLLACVLFAFVGWLFVKVVVWLRHHIIKRPMWRFALAGLASRPGLSVIQISALAIGMMIMLLLVMVRNDLLAGWRNTLPSDTPNYFLVNVQDIQLQDLHAMLKSKGLSVVFEPMIRGRLVQINGQEVKPTDYEQERAQRLLQREFNLSYMTQQPEGNRLTEGRWLDPQQAEISFEDELADLLGIKLGDELTFNVAGNLLQAKVTSLRHVKWDSMRVNFFAVMTPKVLQDQPKSWITSFFLPASQLQVTQDVVQRYPNITVINVAALLQQLGQVLDRITLAVEFLFVFTFTAGIVVLISAFLSSYDERIQTAAMMRALGATRRQLDTAQRFELMLIGFLAGLLAAVGAMIIAHVLAIYVFEFDLSWLFMPLVWTILLGMVTSTLGGQLALLGVKNTPPLRVLSEVPHE